MTKLISITVKALLFFCLFPVNLAHAQSGIERDFSDDCPQDFDLSSLCLPEEASAYVSNVFGKVCASKDGYRGQVYQDTLLCSNTELKPLGELASVQVTSLADLHKSMAVVFPENKLIDFSRRPGLRWPASLREAFNTFRGLSADRQLVRGISYSGSNIEFVFGGFESKSSIIDVDRGQLVFLLHVPDGRKFNATLTGPNEIKRGQTDIQNTDAIVFDNLILKSGEYTLLVEDQFGEKLEGGFIASNTIPSETQYMPLSGFEHILEVMAYVETDPGTQALEGFHRLLDAELQGNPIYRKTVQIIAARSNGYEQD